MAHERLICPTCQFSLTPQSGAATGMSCPRCNSWVDIDPKCTGSCLSCHKTEVAEPVSPCTTAAEILVQIDKTCCGGQSSGAEQTKKSADNKAEKGLKALFKRLFTVR